ncbi:hypothetical protein BpHYR1_022340 [Brachionus plicatilis]|uniref:Uncharacterized protein n=1 Tax=Brachionus plicatilis TaxID=10195 RepID=A0A3M7T326_BRAPC|nr:hypothetical protein BpHYR1_022340 [Brachionus plicatilis]
MPKILNFEIEAIFGNFEWQRSFSSEEPKHQLIHPLYHQYTDSAKLCNKSAKLRKNSFDLEFFFVCENQFFGCQKTFPDFNIKNTNLYFLTGVNQGGILSPFLFNSFITLVTLVRPIVQPSSFRKF